MSCVIKNTKGKATPLQAWTVPQGSRKLRFPDFMTTPQDSNKFVSLTHRPPLPPGNTPGTHFGYSLSHPQGHSAIGRILYQLKIPMTPAGIETATFRFVAQYLNHCATAVPDFSFHYIYVSSQQHKYSPSMRHALGQTRLLQPPLLTFLNVGLKFYLV